jgi:hypothetical protein
LPTPLSLYYTATALFDKSAQWKMEMSNEQTYRSKAERHCGARKPGIFSRLASTIAGRHNVVVLIIVIIVLLALISIIG